MSKQKIAAINMAIIAAIIAFSLHCAEKKSEPKIDIEKLRKISTLKTIDMPTEPDSAPAKDIYCRDTVKSWEKAKSFKIKRLPKGKKIDINDRSLNDWNRSYLIFSVNDNNAKKSQWKDIRGYAPQKLKPGDINLKVYMAIDSSSWYIGVKVIDDKIIQPPIRKAYSGDCAEIFFVGAGDAFENEGDYNKAIFDHRKHVLIMNSLDLNSIHSEDYRKIAFFQLELPASDSANCDFFPKYRNDVLGEKMEMLSFRSVMVTLQKNGYIAEVKIPLQFLEPSILKKISAHKPLKLGFDYLDYDKENGKPEHYGFSPDNVFCPGNDEREVNCPYFMGNVIFE